MFKSNDLNRNSIITGILLNLIVSLIFIVFIILGYKSTTENAAIQDDTFRTHFQSRLILKSINGLNHSRADVLIAMKNNSVESINNAEDDILGAKSNYHILLSEQSDLNKNKNSNKISSGFETAFTELTELYEDVFKQKNVLQNKQLLQNILDKSSDLISRMHSEESSLWVEESMTLHDFSKIKERNLMVFYALTVCFVLIQIVFIYFTIIKYQLSKKINLQQERLILQTRLSTLGMMSAELAHEINSPLMVIDGRLRILQNEISSSDAGNEKVLKNIEIIKRNSQRIQGIIRSFKTMSKSGEKDEFEQFYLTSIFEDVKDLVSQKLIDENINFSVAEVSEVIYVMARRIQIVQVLTNLINNSFDAIKETKGAWIKVESSVENEKILIMVTDSGEGIPAANIDQIFDPFYSTKGSVAGTGLGLSISKKIMKEHGGDLVYNMASRNTQFVMTFKNEKATQKSGLEA